MNGKTNHKYEVKNYSIVISYNFTMPAISVVNQVLPEIYQLAAGRICYNKLDKQYL